MLREWYLKSFSKFSREHFRKFIFFNYFACLFFSIRYHAANSLDSVGRLASAKGLFEVGLHGYNDHFFLGTIQNLFYPPLQDILLGGLLKINELGHFLSAPILLLLFVNCIFLFYLYSLYTLAKQIPSLLGQFFFILFTSWTLYLDLYSGQPGWGQKLNFFDQPYPFYFQGINFQDIFITGLTNQLLGAGFFNLFVTRLLQKKHTQTALYLSLTILSHFIWGGTGILILFLWTTLQKNWTTLLKTVSWTLGLTAFFWIPMVASGSFMVVESVTPMNVGVWLIMTPFIFLFFRPQTASFFFSLTSAILALVVAYSVFASTKNWPLPDFHYYRFLYPSLFMMILAVSFSFKQLHSGYRSFAIPVLFSLCWTLQFSGKFYSFDYSFFKNQNIPIQTSEISMPADFQRSFLLSLNRPIDFSAESLLYLNGQRDFFTKGLYWESAKTNKTLSEFFMELLGGPSVLQSDSKELFQNQSCEIYTCGFTQFLRMTGTKELWLPSKEELLNAPYSEYEGRQKITQCYDSLTARLVATREQIHIGTYSLQQYLVPNSSLVSSPLDIVHFQGVEGALKNCQTPSQITRYPTIELSRLGSGTYEVKNATAQTESIALALQYFPGMIALDKNGNQKKITETKIGMTLESSETIRIEYHRPLSYKMSYLLSAFVLLAFILNSVRNRDNHRSEK